VKPPQDGVAPSGALVGVEERRETLDKIAASVRACTRCRLHATRIHAVPGEGPIDASIVLIGEAPGREEDASGRPFVGAAGMILDKALQASGLPRRETYITNVVKCRPPGNRRPKADEIASCRPYLLAEIEAVRPQVVVTLGATALRGLLGHSVRFKEARGRPIESGGVLLWPTYHPAATLYNRRLEAEIRSDLRSARRLLVFRRSRNPAKGHRSEKRSSPVNARRRGPSRAAKRSGRRSR
jgi:DNA polymerase